MWLGLGNASHGKFTFVSISHIIHCFTLRYREYDVADMYDEADSDFLFDYYAIVDELEITPIHDDMNPAETSQIFWNITYLNLNKFDLGSAPGLYWGWVVSIGGPVVYLLAVAHAVMWTRISDMDPSEFSQSLMITSSAMPGSYHNNLRCILHKHLVVVL